MRNTYHPETIHLALGDAFYDRVEAASFPQAILRYRNARWATRVGLDGLTDQEWINHFGRFSPLPGSLPAPLALRYHGHQFRSYNPDLGDGRGFLFAQVRDNAGRLLDLGTKGSGQTPYSRRGDGRLTLKGGVREVLATAMLEALGVDTSKSFSLIETGEALERGDEPSPTRSSVLVRLSHSHIRIGTFQRLLAMNDAAGVEKLLDHCIAHYAPEAARDASYSSAFSSREPLTTSLGNALPDRAAAFLASAMKKCAATAARWMAAGFVHGVLNSDNINITGESFDYGPWRFLPHYEPGFTAAYFDQTGLYAFARQPDAIGWNLARLAECLTLLAPLDALEPAMQGFGDAFWHEMRIAFTRRLGLRPDAVEADDALIHALFAFLRETKIPFEGAMFDLFGGISRLEKAQAGPRANHYAHPSFAPLEAMLAMRVSAPGARLEDVYFARAEPFTLVIGEVEQLWAPIAADDNWSAFQAKLGEIDQVRRAYGFAGQD